MQIHSYQVRQNLNLQQSVNLVDDTVRLPEVRGFLFEHVIAGYCYYLTDSSGQSLEKYLQRYHSGPRGGNNDNRICKQPPGH